MRYPYRPTVLDIGVFRLRRCERACTSSALTHRHIAKYLYSIGIYLQGDIGRAHQLGERMCYGSDQFHGRTF
jgi:hypothetical protein